MPRIILAENNPLIRASLVSLCEKTNSFRVVAAVGGSDELLTLSRAVRADVLICSDPLRGDATLDVVEQIRTQAPSMRVVVLTPAADPHQVGDHLMAGAVGFVSWEDGPEALYEAVRAAARGDEVWLSPRVAACLLPGREGAAPQGELTAREREVLEMTALGTGNDDIADALHIAPGTVRNHLSNIYAKLSVQCRAEAVAWAWTNGLVKQRTGRP